MRSAIASLLLPLLIALPAPAAALTANLTMEVVAEGSGQLFGQAIVGDFDFNGDGHEDLAISAPLFTGGGINLRGKVYIYLRGPGSDEVVDVTPLGAAVDDNLGWSVASAGDVNNDGYDDLVVGALDCCLNPGFAHLYLGGAVPDGTADLTMTGASNDDLFGYSVSGLGDVNGDSFDDWIVGAFQNDTGGSNAGRAYVYYGGSTPNSTVDLTLTGAASNDRFGVSVSGAGDVNGDGFDDILVGAEGHDAGGNFAGRAYVFYGGSTPNNTPDLFFDGAESRGLGNIVSEAGDMNGDGYADIVAGYYRDATGGSEAGSLFVFFGGVTPNSTPDLLIEGDTSDSLGQSVDSAGDVNGDGYDDLIVGVPGGGSAGEVHVYLGGPGLDAKADIVLGGPEAYDRMGRTVGRAGDVNDDGFDDLLVASAVGSGEVYIYTMNPFLLTRPNGGEQWVAGRPASVRWYGRELVDIALSTDAGATWVTVAEDIGGGTENSFEMIAPSPATDRALVRIRIAGLAISPSSIDISDAVFSIVEPHDPPAASYRLQATLVGEANSDQFGQAVDTGDWNADGFPDIAVGASGNDGAGSSAGRAYVFFGGPTFNTTADVVISGVLASDVLGRALGNAGDVNGDGNDDLVVAAPGNDLAFSGGGAAYVFFGGPGFDATADLTLLGEAASDGFGDAATGAGDVNGDGYDDVLVTADSNDAGGTSAGAAYIYFGGATPDAVYDLRLLGETGADFLGGSGAGLGDVNGDGYDDWGVGATGNDAGGSVAGRAYICLGGALPNAVPDLVLTGETAGDNLGTRIAPAGDVNGDGFDDFLVGAPLNDAGGASAGRTYLHFGGRVLDTEPDLVVQGLVAGENVGFAMRGAGDVNADGYADLLIGAYTSPLAAPGAGRAMLLLGGPGLDAAPEAEYRGASASMVLGADVCGAGDVNDDGFGDFLVAATQSASGPGRVQLFDGRRFHFDAPNGGATWNVGATETIAWSGAEPADLWLSVDGGSSYALLEDNVGGAAENTLRLLVPHQPTRFARLRLTPADAAVSGNAETDSLFTIEASIALLNLKAEPVPNGGGIQLSWETNPGPADLAGYRIERAARGGGAGSGGESGNGAPAWTTLVPLTRSTTYIDINGTPGARYRLSGINGLGQDIVLGEIATTPAAALAAWPLPYRGGALAVSFLTAGGLGGAPGPATVALFDVAGRRVRTLAAGDFAAGTAEAAWDGTDDHGRPVASGLYFLRATTGSSDTKLKVVVVR